MWPSDGHLGEHPRQSMLTLTLTVTATVTSTVTISATVTITVTVTVTVTVIVGARDGDDAHQLLLSLPPPSSPRKPTGSVAHDI